MNYKWYRRERYLSKVEPFIHDDGLIKVISGIRRCGKSCLMATIAEDVLDAGVCEDHVILLDLDSRALTSVCTPEQLNAAIEERLPKELNGTVYLFIDEVQNVSEYETVINAYRSDGGFSIFITGSNSYLLSGELATKLTGRYIEIELFTLTFDEFRGMREFLGKPQRNISEDFREWLRFGGFPKAVEYDDPAAKARYIEDVVEQIIQKDIRAKRKIGNLATFDKVMTYVINNFAAPTNLSGIAKYLERVEGTPVKRQTVAAYVDLLVKAKVLYRCNRFDMKSKQSLQGGEKYYLADLGIYYARNVDATLSFGPLLENVTYIYLRSRDYSVSVGVVGELEIDFIARRASDFYLYIQVSMSVVDPAVEDREYRSFEKIRDSYPRYVLTLDPLPLQRDGVRGVNLMELMAAGEDL